MNQCIRIGISVFVAFFVYELSGYQPDKVQPFKDLTVLVYIAGDNDLHPFIESDLAEMKRVGSNKNLNILAYVNTKYDGQPKVTRKLMVNAGSVTQFGEDKAYDSGNPETVMKACKWAHVYFPSNKLVLIFWNHGSGALNRLGSLTHSPLFGPSVFGNYNRSVCYDDTYNSTLSDADLQKALDFVCNELRRGKKIDIVAFDACLMADIEVAYAIAPYAQYMVASQQTIPGDGYGYDRFLGPLARSPLATGVIAQLMVAAYKQEYALIEDDYTLSALNLALLDPLVKNVNLVAQLLTKQLRSSSKQFAYTAIKAAVSPKTCTHYAADGHIDLANFYTNCLSLLSSMKIQDKADLIALQAALKDGLQMINRLVIANVCGKDVIKSRGISIYLPETNLHMGYAQLYWGKATKWFEFLRMFNGR